jgi:hypothetical protein
MRTLKCPGIGAAAAQCRLSPALVVVAARHRQRADRYR